MARVKVFVYSMSGALPLCGVLHATLLRKVSPLCLTATRDMQLFLHHTMQFEWTI
jgi:hypothetical protein